MRHHKSRRERLLALADEIVRIEDGLKAKQKELEDLMQDRQRHPSRGEMPAVRPAR